MLGRSYTSVALAVAGWVALAWLGADYYYDRLAHHLYLQDAQLARQEVEQVADSVGQGIQLFKAIALMVSRDAGVHRALQRFGPDAVASGLPYQARKQGWTSDSTLHALDKTLGRVATDLDADVVWVMNAAGDCIASSNAHERDSFVGANFAFREYFRQARAGRRGHQYAIGRVSKVAGLYFSAPIFQNGRFLGAAIVKRDIREFAAWTKPASAFISDTNGVIVLAPDPRLEFHTLPNAPATRMSVPARELQYRRQSLEPLEITPWLGGQFPGAVRIGDGQVPVVFASKGLPEDGITLHVAHPLGELVGLGRERDRAFILLACVGSVLIVAAWMLVRHRLRQAHLVETDLRIAAAAFQAQDSIVITDSRGVIQRVNQAFTEMTGYTATDALGQTPRLLRSGRHDGPFYAAMWDSLNRTGAWAGEIWNRRKDGEVYPGWLSITAVKGSSGEITHYVGTINDISQRKAAEEEIRNLAFYDPLTRLPNRRLLTDRLNHALAASARSGHSGALLFIDLDNFKTLNDTLGHPTGDLLLEQVAERLLGCVREDDTVARFGGDEFVVILERLSAHADEAATQTRTAGEKILATLNQPYQLAGHKKYSTSSIGATLFLAHRATAEELLKQADLAMYQAKTAGRNVLRFFDQGMQSMVNAMAAMEADLRQALQHHQFVLYYQPQVDQDGRLTGAEALVRWRHPERGLVSPGEFMPLAEDTGLILPLGQWVLESACARLLDWAGRPETAHLTLAVNVSARQFRQPDFAPQVLAALDHAGADARRLKLELTESLLLHDFEDVIAKMTALKIRGVGFSLDDFGTGYSSLAYLKRLPLDEVKIDQSFVRDVLTDANDAAIARTIVALARTLGLSVIAEGVETEAQRDFLAREGCHAYQGYLFGKPVPVQTFEAYLSGGPDRFETVRRRPAASA